MQVMYDPQEVQYERLLDTFFQHVDPTTKDRQGGDRGTQYRSAVYYHTPEQKAAAQAVSAQPATCLNPQFFAEFRSLSGSRLLMMTRVLLQVLSSCSTTQPK